MEAIEIVVSGLEGGGDLRAGAYADDGRWLSDGGSVGLCVAPVANGTARCTISVPGPGTYAVAFLHDADRDGVMGKNLLGLPTEGFGFSRDPSMGLRGPKFADAALVVTAGATVRAEARARYGL